MQTQNLGSAKGFDDCLPSIYLLHLFRYVEYLENRLEKLETLLNKACHVGMHYIKGDDERFIAPSRDGLYSGTRR